MKNNPVVKCHTKKKKIWEKSGIQNCSDFSQRTENLIAG